MESACCFAVYTNTTLSFFKEEENFICVLADNLHFGEKKSIIKIHGKNYNIIFYISRHKVDYPGVN